MSEEATHCSSSVSSCWEWILHCVRSWATTALCSSTASSSFTRASSSWFSCCSSASRVSSSSTWRLDSSSRHCLWTTYTLAVTSLDTHLLLCWNKWESMLKTFKQGVTGTWWHTCNFGTHSQWCWAVCPDDPGVCQCIPHTMGGPRLSGLTWCQKGHWSPGRKKVNGSNLSIHSVTRTHLSESALGTIWPCNYLEPATQIFHGAAIRCFSDQREAVGAFCRHHPAG